MDTDVLRVATQTAPPQISPGDFCSDPEPHYSDKFAPGSTVYAVAYVRDLQRSTPVTVSPRVSPWSANAWITDSGMVLTVPGAISSST